jgi:archaellum component FlaC
MTNVELIKVVDTQKETINRLTNRIGLIADDLALLKAEIGTFKSQVASDMKKVVTTLQKR